MMLFDNRELAILLWLALGLGLALMSKRTRSSVGQAAQALVQPKLVFFLWLPMIAYVDLVLWLMGVAGIWTSDLVSETIFWLFGPGIVLFSRFDKAAKDPHFLRRGLLAILEFTIVIEFVVNLYPLNLVIELFLVPVLFFLGATLVVATLKPEYHPAKVLLETLLALIGFALVIYGVVWIVRNPVRFATVGNLREFVVPILLTLGFAPFVYAVAVLTTYGRLFALLSWKLDENRGLARYAKWRLFRATFGRLRSLRQFNLFPWRLTASMDREAVRRVVARFKSGNTGSAP